MTRFRKPCGWGSHQPSFKRPSLPGWLSPQRDVSNEPQSVKRSYEYWTQIHWATPPWISAKQWQEMKFIYSWANPGRQHVDHIVPLKHLLVSGLNVPWNIQTLSCDENLKKSNFYWPDCPDHLCPEKNKTADMFGTRNEVEQYAFTF